MGGRCGRGVLGMAIVLSLGAPGPAAAQPAWQLYSDLGYSCVQSTCTAAGEACDYGGSVLQSCVDHVPGWPLCSDHLNEVYCCRGDMADDCPPSTSCKLVGDEGFGVCLGLGLTFCNPDPTLADLDACRAPFTGGYYDWGHGDCDGDSIQNDADSDPCRSGTCPCNADIAAPGGGTDGVVGTPDHARVLNCILNPDDPTCDSTVDINCDGAIDYCDRAAVTGLFGATSPDPAVCAALVCGACRLPGDCVIATPDVCDVDMRGTFLGEGTSCTPTPPDSGTPPPTSDATFRGAGGCQCRSTPSSPLPPAALLLVLLALSRRR